MRSKFTIILICLSFLLPLRARAVSRDVRSFLLISTYGIVGGGIAGLVAWPMTRNSRTPFQGMSLGLYLGMIVGVFYVYNQDDPENPLSPQSPYPGIGELDERAVGPQLDQQTIEFSWNVARF